MYVGDLEKFKELVPDEWFNQSSNDKTPDQLKIIPPLSDRGIAVANIGFIAYHKAVPIIDFRYLVQTAILNLDWQDPWYTKFENKNLTRHHKYPLMLYIYVEPRQVRFESLLRINDITELTGFNNENANASTADNLCCHCRCFARL